MAACDILPSSIQSTLAGSAFSPLTLFESTITNAQMLIESMAERELFSALKIIDGLHTHVVQVMEPRYSRVCDRSDRLGELETSGAAHAAASSGGQQAGTPANNSTPGFYSSPSKDEKAGSILGAALNSIKVENSELGDDEEDCVITDDFNEDSLSFGAGFPYAKIARLDYSVDGGGGANSSASQTDVPAECKTIMRRAYKALKGNGAHLFDFSLPFSSDTNQRVAAMVMAKAKEMAEGKGWPDDVWQRLPPASRALYLFQNFRAKSRMRFKMAKLNRRQKSFELVATTLSSDELEKFRVILTRDYTSSDEECGSGGSDQLRVRELAWESDEVKRLKNQLDQVYSDNCATTKQKVQLGKCIRDPLRSRSQRPPPESAPNWALKAPMRKS